MRPSAAPVPAARGRSVDDDEKGERRPTVGGRAATEYLRGREKQKQQEHRGYRGEYNGAAQISLIKVGKLYTANLR